VIVASGLTRRFGSRTVVDDVSFTVGQSEIVALLGPNGAGKTTTLRMLAGLIGPSGGSVSLDGVRLTRTTAAAMRRRIGFLTETPGLWDRLTVRENLIVYAGLYALDRPGPPIDRLLEMLDLSAHQKARAAELSKGMRQKVAIARALMHDPVALLLDEPTSGLDPEIARTVRELISERRRAGCAILVSTHNLDEAERLADRVAVLQRRLVAIDTPVSLRRRLKSNRVTVRLTGRADAFLSAARSIDPSSTADGDRLSLTLESADRETPLLVRALVAAGADILEVRPEVPLLEDVYLHLVGENGTARR
jgi:ABC-2 type transport system ATP-binding protein